MIEGKTTLIENSPVEFILFGPYEGKDKILVKSSTAHLDLVGLASFHWVSKLDARFTGTSLITSLFRKRIINVIESRAFDDINPKIDERQGNYRFVWVGLCSSSNYEAIRSFFNDVVLLLRQSIVDQNREDIEINVSGLIYKCSEANQKRIYSRKLFFTVLFLYLALVISMGIYVYLRSIKFHGFYL